MACRWLRWGNAAIGIVIACGSPCAAADPENPLFVPLAEESHSLMGGGRAYRLDRMAFDDTGGPSRGNKLRQRLGIDLTPAIGAIFGFFHQHGLPLREQHDDEGDNIVGVQAAFSVGANLPAVNFNLGDRPVEPLGAFYSAERGFRCAVVWPIDRFTLRIEGGEDSEFGYYGIAGVQWVHRRLPIAVGIGVPMNLRNAEGDIGVIAQFRMRID
jgi:hypothetical protein